MKEKKNVTHTFFLVAFSFVSQIVYHFFVYTRTKGKKKKNAWIIIFLCFFELNSVLVHLSERMREKRMIINYATMTSIASK